MHHRLWESGLISSTTPSNPSNSSVHSTTQHLASRPWRQYGTTIDVRGFHRRQLIVPTPPRSVSAFADDSLLQFYCRARIPLGVSSRLSSGVVSPVVALGQREPSPEPACPDPRETKQRPSLDRAFFRGTATPIQGRFSARPSSRSDEEA